MANYVYPKSKAEADRLKEEYELLGWNVKRDGERLVISWGKKKEKKREERPKRNEDEERNSPRGRREQESKTGRIRD